MVFFGMGWDFGCVCALGFNGSDYRFKQLGNLKNNYVRYFRNKTDRI